MVIWSIFKRSKEEWNDSLISHDFFSLYQSYEWGEIKKNDGWNVVRIEAKNNSESSQGQLLVKYLPLRGAFVWVPGGFHGKLLSIDLKELSVLLNVKFCYLRSSFHDPKIELAELQKLNFKIPACKLNSNLSMNLDLSVPEDELVNRMSSNWRHNSKRGKKRNPSIEVWSNPDPDELFDYYMRFEAMKGLAQQHSKQSIEGVINHFKENLVIVRSLDTTGDLLALRGFIFKGDRALDWYAVSTNQGRSNYSSYIVTLELLKKAKSLGVKTYDLSGVDPVNNAGVYNFKKGIGGELVSYPGEYEKSSHLGVGFILNQLIKRKYKNS